MATEPEVFQIEGVGRATLSAEHLVRLLNSELQRSVVEAQSVLQIFEILRNTIAMSMRLAAREAEEFEALHPGQAERAGKELLATQDAFVDIEQNARFAVEVRFNVPCSGSA